MLDREGFRPNVGIILLNSRNQVFWGKRLRTHSWQFPQGGINYGETPEQAMFRELQEEVGLLPEHVQILARTREARTFDQAFVDVTGTTVGDSAEVESMMWVPRAELLAPGTYHGEVWGTPPTDRLLHFFELSDETVWGATAHMLVDLLTRTVVP